VQAMVQVLLPAAVRLREAARRHQEMAAVRLSA